LQSRWSDAEAARRLADWAPRWGAALALRTYTARLLGADPALVLHGGGNTSVKDGVRDVFGDERAGLFVKASGRDLATVEPADHVALDLPAVRRLVAEVAALDDAAAERELLLCRLDPAAAPPSIEAPVHAVLPGRFVDHTHADAVLALTNRPDGEAVVREALGAEVLVLPYAVPGHPLARVVAAALGERPEARAMVWLRHGLVTWGEEARESYERTVELVARAEAFLAREVGRGGAVVSSGRRAGRARVTAVAATSPELAGERLARSAPLLRRLLSEESGDADRPWRRVLLQAECGAATGGLLAAGGGVREAALGPPLTADHLVRTKPWPLWVDDPAWDDPDRLREQLAAAVAAYAVRYRAYLDRHRHRLPAGIRPFDPLPRVVLLPGLGVVAAGASAADAAVARDIAVRTLSTKARLAAAGVAYEGLAEDHLFDMEYRPLQHAKLAGGTPRPPLAGGVALVTGAAGAIGSGIARGLLEAGGHVLVTDLPGPALASLEEELGAEFPGRVVAAAVDVTDAASVAAGFDAACRAWGGVDLVVASAGLAHVAGLEEMALADFERLERVNVHGTLLVLAEAARRFRLQAMGGDVVLVSTKNVFAPGASFGAYSATKAAAHQLARIASQELAALGVRVNMVAPDAVFGEGGRRSGLWAEVGPARMRARGLDEADLEEYYRGRNLLGAAVTARHVANAVLYFATRQSPTTGATLPVDGGLPDATPR
jgi:rhamnose utilization protein RhaD (predicted bifunctional aldolase and dehydrogenase)/NAD(P)-dependent dehydrogenase (short-subunit alcohol dehydrogenase family)